MTKSYKDMTDTERAEHIAARQAVAKAKRIAAKTAKDAAHAAYMAEPYHTGYTADNANQASRRAQTEREQAQARKAVSDAVGNDSTHVAALDACDAAGTAITAAMNTEPSDI